MEEWINEVLQNKGKKWKLVSAGIFFVQKKMDVYGYRSLTY